MSVNVVRCISRVRAARAPQQLIGSFPLALLLGDVTLRCSACIVVLYLRECVCMCV